tara:strand:+ start:2983 stop:3285 length:303 start_codon:yes stop_codon:yes gene_type:complete
MAEVVNKVEELKIPSQLVMNHAAKLAINEDKPIMMDYWNDSDNDKVFFGIKGSGEKLLVRSEDEYTSPIGKIFKVDKEYIVMTENSIYIVSASCNSKRIA